ncbi:MAG: septum formation family protein [Actinobacteria bacterium]|nr:septum formation family protein [Actinomycetota bacterium]
MRGRTTSIGILLLALAGCSTEDPGPQAGDCFVDPPRQVDSTPTVDCAEAVYELVAVSDLADEGAFPGREALSSLAFDRCSMAVEEYTGVELVTSDYDLWFHHPDEASWSSGNRQFVCAVTRVDGQPLGGSVAG